MKKVILTILLLVALDAAVAIYANSIDAPNKTELALATVNGGSAQAATVRNYSWAANNIFWLTGLLNLAIVALTFRKEIKTTIQKLTHE